MTSVVFHPSLGRFAGEELGSGSESDSFYRRRAGAAPPSRREVGLHHGAAPGSRRMRRYINDTTAFSESEYDTATDWESDEDRPIVRFEWEARFLQAGPSFFDASTASLPAARGAPARRRRLPKLSRRKRGEVHAGVGDTDDEDDLALVGLGAGDAAAPSAASALAAKREAVRRARAAKFGASSTAATDATSAASSSSAAPSGSDSEAASSSIADRSAPQGLQRHTVSERSGRSSHLPGQEHAGTLFLQLEHSVRRSLRRLQPDDSAWSMLAELESLLVRYKRGRLLRHPGDATHAATFDLLPPDSALELDPSTSVEDDIKAEPTSDDDDLILVSPSRRRRERGASSSSSTKSGRKTSDSSVDAPLLLVFRSSFDRFLAHGLIHFHALVGESFSSPTNEQLRITRVRTPRKGVLMHAARMVPFLQQQASQHQHTH